MAENENSDQAAIAAAEAFWDGDKDQAASSEVPESEPAVSSGQSAAYKAAAANEQADQRMSLEQDGSLDPAEADGIPKPQSNKNDKTPVGKSPVTPKGNETPAEETGLDPILRDIAKEAFGWTDERIDKLYSLDPELATETLTGLASNYADLSRQFLAAPAPQAAATIEPPAQVPAQQATQLAAAKLPDFLSDAELAKLVETEGEKSVNLIKGLRDHFSAKNSALEDRVTKAEQKYAAAETNAIAQEAGSTVTSLTEKYPKLYGAGDDMRVLTVDQYQKRVELASKADQIRSGALARGQVMSVKDAINAAHRIVAFTSLKTEARTELQKQIKTRSKQVTVRPTQRNNPKAVGHGRSDEAATEAAAQKMAEIGMNDQD